MIGPFILNKVHCTDVFEGLRKLPDNSIQCIVTSPPYYGLREYGTGGWDGGDPACEHKVGGQVPQTKHPGASEAFVTGIRPGAGRKCKKCGAVRIDQQIGLEETPAAYVERLVEVFREARRVLRLDGVLWLNLGDSFSTQNFVGNRTGCGGSTLNCFKDGYVPPVHRKDKATSGLRRGLGGLKPKDLIGVPWRVAFALQEDGWWLRADCIWNKLNPMPSSCKDRPTIAHEYIFLLTKSAHYFYDSGAVKEPYEGLGVPRPFAKAGNSDRNDTGRIYAAEDTGGRNKRSVWTLPLAPFSEAHFAVFPPKLVEPCILAGCPEKACVVCGKPDDLITEADFKKCRGCRDCLKDKEYRKGIVLDPFAGSGTTIVVANKLGRDAIGFDLSSVYTDMANRRIKRETQQQALRLM